MKAWPFNAFGDVRETVPRTATAGAGALAAYFRRARHFARKEMAPLFNVCELHDLRHGRRTENIKATHAIVGDIDAAFDRGEFDKGLQWLEDKGVFVIAYETFSSTPDAPRWRILAFLDEPIPPQDYGRSWAGLNVLFGGMLDPAAKDAARISYVPGCPEGQTREVRVVNEALWTR